MNHELKSWPWYFERLMLGHKTFELRREDNRKFSVGDILWIREWDPAGGYTGRSVKRRVLSVLDAAMATDIGSPLADGWVILSLQVAT